MWQGLSLRRWPIPGRVGSLVIGAGASLLSSESTALRTSYSHASFAVARGFSSSGPYVPTMQPGMGLAHDSFAYEDEPNKLAHYVSQELGLPMFKASSSSIHRIESPRQFYGLLKQKIGQAKRRIFLATLYVGKEERELAYFLCRALARNPALQLTLLMDAMRATRESPKSISSASLLSHLASMFPDQVDIRLYSTPLLRPGSFKSRLLGKRFNEGFGLQHMKIYGFDDDVIMSGANLSRDYFTRRKDRYMLIRQHAPLADYLHSLILLISRFSYAVHYSGDTNLLAHCKKNVESLDDFSTELTQVYKSPFRLTWDGGRDLLLTEDADGTIVPSGLFPPSNQYHVRNWASQAHKDLLDFTERWKQRCEITQRSHCEKADTCIVPLLQMGQLNISQETAMIPYLIKFIEALQLRPSKSSQAVARPFTTVDITSGYFTLSSIYRSLVLSDKLHQVPAESGRVPVAFRLVAASPEANGFFGSRGITNRIPAAYTYMESEFWNEVMKKSLDRPVDPAHPTMQDAQDPVSTGPISAVELREWRKYGWTYHSKGMYECTHFRSVDLTAEPPQWPMSPLIHPHWLVQLRSPFRKVRFGVLASHYDACSAAPSAFCRRSHRHARTCTRPYEQRGLRGQGPQGGLSHALPDPPGQIHDVAHSSLHITRAFHGHGASQACKVDATCRGCRGRKGPSSPVRGGSRGFLYQDPGTLRAMGRRVFRGYVLMSDSESSTSCL